MQVSCTKCNKKIDRFTHLSINPTTYICKVCRVRLLPSLTAKELEIIEGWMLSDGCIQKNGKYTHGCKFKNVLENLQSRIISLGWTDIRIKTNSYIQRNNKTYGPYTSYTLTSRVHPDLKQLEKQWYIPHPNPRPNCKRLKIIPPNFQLTPTKAYYWFIGDGSAGEKSKSICLATQGFREEDIKLLSNLLSNQVGIENHIRGGMIYIESKETIIKFFDYIGPCQDLDFTYKWEILKYANSPYGWSEWWKVASEDQKEKRVQTITDGARKFWNSEEGKQIKKTQRKYQIEDSELVQMYNSGLGTKEIADKVGCAQGTIRSRLIRSGIQLRDRSKASKIAWSKRS